MSNPFSVATRGKGVLPTLVRGAAIANHYGITSTKIDRAVSQLSSTLERFHCHATIPITALALAHNLNLARKYKAQGLELAVHGFSHVDYHHLSLESQIDHLHQAEYIFKQAGSRPIGFRSPYLHWNMDTLAALKDCGFAYDSSQALNLAITNGLETSGYRRVLDFYQAHEFSQYPALPWQEAGLVRIPYCLPDDEALVERMKITNNLVMAELWLTMLDRIYEAGELFTLGLHPERVPICNQALETVLRKARSLSPPVWIARLDEIVAWYKLLGRVTFEAQQESVNRLRIKVQVPHGATILVRSLEVETATEPWMAGYKCVAADEFTILSSRHPFIGIAPDTPPSLISFLKHQGYIVEISADSQNFSYYIKRTSFVPEDERLLLVDIEKGDWPLVRLSRWPGAARCVLAITGDVDAFTIWDYGRRIINS